MLRPTIAASMGILWFVILLFITFKLAHADVSVQEHCYHDVQVDHYTGKVIIDSELTCESTPRDWKDNDH